MPMSTSLRAIASSIAVLAAACAHSAASPEGPASPPKAEAARDQPAVAGPPRYRPSSSSPAPIPITDDAYGAYGPAHAAPHLGDTLADFELPLSDGGRFSLRDARGAGPVVVIVYRGFW